MLASLLVVGSVLFGLGIGGAASTVSTIVAADSISTVEGVGESELDTSTRRRAARRVTSRSAVDSDSTSGPFAPVEQSFVRVLRHVPPSWRGPPVLLI